MILWNLYINYYMIYKVMENNIIFIPIKINNIISSFLYESDKKISKHKEIWNINNKKQLILINNLKAINDYPCDHYLTIKNYNEFPCWYCRRIHTLRICILYMRDMSRVYKLYDNIHY